MKHILLIVFVFIVACNNNDSSKPSSSSNDSSAIDPGNPDTTGQESNNLPPAVEQEPGKTFANTRFRNVTVERIGNNNFRIKGQAQIFEASFGWVIEDGHNELKEGFATADMGAPEWGNFDFTVETKKQRPNSTLHIILYETSMKDGSRQHELPIKLW